MKDRETERDRERQRETERETERKKRYDGGTSEEKGIPIPIAHAHALTYPCMYARACAHTTLLRLS